MNLEGAVLRDKKAPKEEQSHTLMPALKSSDVNKPAVKWWALKAQPEQVKEALTEGHEISVKLEK